jgi:hypothetical protein
VKKILSFILSAALLLSIGLILSNANAQGKKVEFPFYVYYDHLARDNHYIPSGWMGDYGAIRVKSAWKENPHSGQTSMRWTYSGEPTQGAGWAGVFWQNPANNWGKVKGGYDLSGATKLTFWARGEKGGEIVEFKIGGIMGDYSDTTEVSTGPVSLTKEWKQYVIDLKGEDLSYISGGFCWVVSQVDVPEGGITFYLDDIVYEK